MEDLPSADLTEVFELPGTGVDFFQTNLVTMTGSYKSTTGTALRTYIFGRDGVNYRNGAIVKKSDYIRQPLSA